jgi:DNA-binding NarL/FixJ family response regulator
MQEIRDRRTDGSALGGDGRTIGVVLCDDMPDLRELTRYGLEQDLRLRVLGEAGSAEECFDAVRALSPDALLLDVTLPDMDGLEAIPELREIAPDLAIVVFSGMDAGRMEGRALARGADAYVEKGTSLSKIRKAVLAAARARGLEVGPSIPLELRTRVVPAQTTAARDIPEDVAEILDEIERSVGQLERRGELLEDGARGDISGIRDRLAALRRRLTEPLI